MTSVGWGKLDEGELRRMLALHTAYFGLTCRTPALARMEASNMLFHIERTLQQGVGAQSVPDAIGPAGTRLVLLVGHDTNIAAVAGLLGLHWTLDQRSDDTPPGIELSFELWQDARGAYSVRVIVSAQTLSQMREMRPITRATPPARQTIAPQGCAATADGCAWADFQHLADTAVDLKDVVTEPAN